jgi:hypothetical protein
VPLLLVTQILKLPAPECILQMIEPKGKTAEKKEEYEPI